MDLSKYNVLFFFVIICLSSLIVSCKTVLQHTIGRSLYKNRYSNGFTNLQDFYYTIPFEMVDGKLFIHVNFSSYEKQFTFLFDTGSRSYISEELAKRFELTPLRNNLKSTDFNGTVIGTDLYQIPNISIGGFNVFNLDVLTMRKDLSINCKRKIDGIIGSNILELAIYQFHPDSETLIITSSVSKLDKKSLSSAVRIRKKWQGDLVSKELRFGSKKKSVTFDSGYNGLLLLRTDSTNGFLNTESTKGPIKERHYALRAQHSEKIHKVSYYKLDDVSLGGMSLESGIVPVVKGGENYFLIGSSLYAMAIITIDAKNDRIYMAPRIRPYSSQGDIRISNIKFNWSKERGAYISALNFNGKLERQGFRVYDSVISINNIEMDQFKDLCSFEAFIESIKMASQEFTFAVKKEGDTLFTKINPDLLYE